MYNRVSTLFFIFLILGNVVFSLGQSKQNPKELLPHIKNNCVSPIIGCNLFTNAANMTCSTNSIICPVLVNNSPCLDGAIDTNFGCLGTQPNQTWVYFTVNSGTNLTFHFANSGTVDTDGAIWGPIASNNLANACSATTSVPKSCDYTPNLTVDLALSNVQVGQIYVLIITNYSGAPSNVEIGQPTGGSVTYCLANPTSCHVPTATLTGNQKVVIGESGNLSVALTGTAPWSIIVNGHTYSNITSSPYTLPISPTTDSTFTLTSVSNSCGTNTSISTANVTVCTKPTAVLTGANNIINGDSTNLSVALTGVAPWSIVVNGHTYNNILTSPFTFWVAPTTTTTYTLTAVTNSCTTNTATTSAIVTVCNRPKATLTGNQTIVIGQSGNLSVALTGVAPWSIIVNGHTYSNIPSSPYTIAISPTTDSTFTLTSVSNSCASDTTKSKATIHTCTKPTAVLTGANNIINGDSTNLSVALTGAAPWSIVVNGHTYNNILTSPFTFWVAPTTTTTYTLTAVTNSCTTNTATSSAIVTVCNRPKATLSGNQTIVIGQSGNLSVALTGVAPWSIIVNGHTYSNILSSPYTIAISPTTDSTFTLTSVSNSCASDTTKSTATIHTCTKPTAVLTGTQTITNGNSTNLSVALTGVAPWAIIINGHTYNNITVSPFTISVAPTRDSTYTLTSVSNSCTTNTATSSATVSVCNPPKATISGTQTISSGQSANLSVAFTGTAPYSIIVNGVTYSTISTTPYILTVSPIDTTTYKLTSVSNYCGTDTTKSSATVTVTYDLNNGLVSCYAFNGNAIDGVGNNNGSVSGATSTTDRFNRQNNAYSFNGTDNYIIIPSTNLNFNQFTYSVWVKPDTIKKDSQFIFDNTQNITLSNLSPNFGWTTSNYRSTQYGPANLAPPLPTDYNKWYHVVVTAAATEVKIYVDGVLMNTVSGLTGNPSYTLTNALIGKKSDNTSYFAGKIDDIRIYNKALNEVEVGLLFRLPATSNCNIYVHNASGLVSCYGFSGDAKDNVGNNNGTVYSGATITNDRFNTTTSAYSFDGVDDYIDVTTNSFINNSYSFSAWVNLTDLPVSNNSYTLLSVGSQVLSVSNSTTYNRVIWNFISSGSQNTTLVSPANITVNINEWKHLVATKSATDVNLYLDGKLIATASNTGTPDYTPSSAFIGKKAGNIQYMKGRLDDIRIYNRAITADEVKSLRYAQGCRVTCPNSLTLVNPYTLPLQPTRNEAGVIIGSNIINTGTEIRYDGQTSVTLNPGFKANQGAVFEAYIDGCGNNK